jgi:hypothetical protein
LSSLASPSPSPALCSLRERCLLALRAHFERPCASALPSRRAHPSLFPGLDPQAAELDDDDDRCLDYFRVYELLIHLGACKPRDTLGRVPS